MSTTADPQKKSERTSRDPRLTASAHTAEDRYVAGRCGPRVDELVVRLTLDDSRFRLAMERAVRSVFDFAEALQRIPGGWEALRRSERRYAVHERRVGIELRRRDRRRARTARMSR